MVPINGKRLQSNLNAANEYGFDEKTGGINRIGFSDADFACRKWLAEQMKSAGMSVRFDKVGNLFGRFGPSDGPCVMSGSHIDSVPSGGKYDGILGVMAAFECVLAIKDAGIQPAIAIEVVATAEEEGRFGGMLGSQAISGQVDMAWMRASRDEDGVPLLDAMASQGLVIKDDATLASCVRTGGSGDGCVQSFIELHIEQGPVLELTNRKIGVVTGISGTCNPIYTLNGVANHSGTTPMNLRRDAMAGFCEIGSAIPGIIEKYGSADGRITIGHVEVSPNFTHTVPGKVTFSANIRDIESSKMMAMAKAFSDVVDEVGKKHGLGVDLDGRLGSLDAIPLDPDLRRVLETETEAYFASCKDSDTEGDEQPWMVMPSGAGHDAQNMQHICPSAMIFVPSKDGVSHSPEEHTDFPDIERGVQILCNVLAKLIQ